MIKVYFNLKSPLQLKKYNLSPILLTSFYEQTLWAIKGLCPSNQQSHKP